MYKLYKNEKKYTNIRQKKKKKNGTITVGKYVQLEVDYEEKKDYDSCGNCVDGSRIFRSINDVLFKWKYKYCK